MKWGYQTYFREPVYTHFSQLPPALLVKSLLTGNTAALALKSGPRGPFCLGSVLQTRCQGHYDPDRTARVSVAGLPIATGHMPHACRQEFPKKEGQRLSSSVRAKGCLNDRADGGQRAAART